MSLIPEWKDHPQGQAVASEPLDGILVVTAAVEKTVATFGRLDVRVNNAGTAIPKRFEETTLEELDRVIDRQYQCLRSR